MAGFVLFAACGSSGSGTTTSSPAQSAAYSTGSAVGSSISGLYQQYKTTKTIDFKNANTYLQLLTLATQVPTIKQNYKNPTFYAQFTQGAISGSQQLVTNSNANSVLNILAGLDLSGITSAGSGSNVTTSTATTVLNSLSGLFSLFSK